VPEPPVSTGVVGGGAQKTIPTRPPKERLAPLILQGSEEQIDWDTEAVPTPAREQAGWVAVLQRHPGAEIGAALGLGLILGTVSRMADSRSRNLGPAEHFRLGAKGAAIAAAAIAAKLGANIAKKVNPKRVRRAAEHTAERVRDFGESLPSRVESLVK
jgi:hypothetical protein